MTLNFCFLHFILTIWIFLALFTHRHEVPTRLFDIFGYLKDSPMRIVSLRAAHLGFLALGASCLLEDVHCTNSYFSRQFCLHPTKLIFTCSLSSLVLASFLDLNPMTLTPTMRLQVPTYLSPFHNSKSWRVFVF